MLTSAPFFPPRASALAREIDFLFFTTLGIAVVFSTLIAVLLVTFAVKFRRRSPSEVGREMTGSTLPLELTWTIIPFLIMMGVFAWGTKIYFEASRPPANAKQFWVVGKQWMWKIEHPDGKREINELHVPINVPIKITLTSEDVIHNFAVPAMRVKADVVPGRYTTLWFEADRLGTFHLFCSQYCGAEHSKMTGKVVVMEPTEYEKWLASGGASTVQTTVATGEQLFAAKACNTCHRADSTARAPMLWGLLGRTVKLLDGQTVVADESYVRESILNPAAKVVAGYQPIMPTFKGQLSEEEVIQLINYIRSLKAAESESAR